MAGKHRGTFWTAFVIAVVAVIGGGVVAYVGYHATAGPDGAVRGYFAALRRSDAPAALAFGDIPRGARTLLTSTVLREQQRIAPISDVQILGVQRHGSSATVEVHYDLAFADNRLGIKDTLTVVRRGHSWHLARVAANTRLDLLQARDRATIVGAAVPDGQLLVFPGAAPIRLDSPYLAVESDTAVISLSSGDDTPISVMVSDAGRAAVRAALASALQSCVTKGARADPRCPLPTSRSVPDSMLGSLAPHAADSIAVVVSADSTGQLQMTGSTRVTGRYTALDFNNVASVHRGTFTLQVQADAYASSPLVVQWKQVGT